MSAYYNEIDPYCAAWLRSLIAAGELPDGVVDERSIADVAPADLGGFTQCHFFAGLGGWPAALRRAGWDDDRPVWTGSCPCQPFSQAGARGGFDDERHLWPDFHWLIAQRRPVVVLGEQVASRDGLVWLDLVSDDMEGLGYALGATVFPSAGVGAPNIRHRIWWCADRLAQPDQRQRGRLANGQGSLIHGSPPGRQQSDSVAESDGSNSGLAGPHSDGRRSTGAGLAGGEERHTEHRSGNDGGMGDAESGRRGEHRVLGEAAGGGQDPRQSAQPEPAGGLGLAESPRLPHANAPAILNSGAWIEERRRSEQSGGARHPWRELEWIDCSDGRQRPTQPGLFPLAARLPGDVARLRAAGNAINLEAAAAVVMAYMELGR